MSTGKAGRPRYKPTEKERQQVRVMTGLGMTHTDISRVIGLTEKTLRRHFREELDAGVAEANAKVAQSLFRQATDSEKPNVIAAIFWMKARAGWRDRDPQDEKGKKQLQAEAAERAAQGRFRPSSSPPRLALVK